VAGASWSRVRAPWVTVDVANLDLRVPNRPSGLQSFGARYRRPVWGMGMDGLVRPGQKFPGPGPGRIQYIRLGNESSGTLYPGTNI